MSMESSIRIFIADSTRDGAELLRRTLEREKGLSVVGVTWDGEEALRRFPDSGADMLICDLLLPRLDGLGLLRRLKDIRRLPHVIVLSAFYNDRIARQVCVMADLFLPKPCSGEELARHIDMCIRFSGEPSYLERTVIRQALLTAGAMPHMDGFRYLLLALERTLRDHTLLRGVTKSLYRDVAKECGTTPACVERSIRAAIERAWERTSPAKRLYLFGSRSAEWTKAPSNVPFLTAMTALLEERGEEFYEKDGQPSNL